MPRLSHAILYDADDKGREALAYGFEVDGINITATGRVDEVDAALASSATDVVVLVVRHEDERAIPLVQRLAQDQKYAQLPRLVLANEPALPASLTGLGGASAFLSLPAFVRDVVTAVKLLAGGAARVRPTTSAGEGVGGDAVSPDAATLEGALSDFGLFFVLRTMVALGLSGIVEVERANRKGELRFHEGEVVSAQVGSLEGQPALHQLLLWEEAALVIHFRTTVRRGQTFLKGDELLEECARFLRDFEHATRSIGHAQSLFVQDAENLAGLQDAVPAELIPVMRLFDGQRNLGDVLEDSPFRAFDTLRTVARLIELRAIRRKAIEKPSTGLAAQGRRARPAQDEWLGRSSAELPIVAATAAPTPAPAEGSARFAPPDHSQHPIAPQPIAPQPTTTHAEASLRGRRSFRRKTGEHAIAPAPGPATAIPEMISNTPTAPLPLPAPAPTAAAGTSGTPVAVAPATQRTERPDLPSVQVHGELRSAPIEPHTRAPIAQLSTALPTMVIDLGPDLVAEPEPHSLYQPVAVPPPVPLELATTREAPVKTPPPAQTEPVPSVAAAAPVVAQVTPPAVVVAQVTPPAVVVAQVTPPAVVVAPITPPAVVVAASEPAPQPRPDVQAAEFDTGMRAPPAPELLAASAGGPSIMIDPGLVEELDAFEMENSAPTPPPVVAGPAPTAPASTATAAPVPAGVVSFVRGAAPARPGSLGPAGNDAPTVSLAPVASATAAPAQPAAPTAAEALGKDAASEAGSLSAPGGQSSRNTPAARANERSLHERRASGEFDALESEFFARESDLYTKEPVENFDDLDPSKGKPRSG